MNQDFGNGVRPKVRAPGNRNSEHRNGLRPVSEPGTLSGPARIRRNLTGGVTGLG